MLSQSPIRKPLLNFAKWYRQLHWGNIFWVIVFPLCGAVAAAFTPLQTKTAIWAVIYHFMTGLGITAGVYLWGGGH